MNEPTKAEIAATFEGELFYELLVRSTGDMTLKNTAALLKARAEAQAKLPPECYDAIIEKTDKAAKEATKLLKD